jgi:seryl-tRNA synthetase
MHDLRALRADPVSFDAALARRGLPAAAEGILEVDRARREKLGLVQQAQARRNALSREIGALRRTGGDSAGLEREAAALAAVMEEEGREAAGLEARLRGLLESLPNILDADVPDGDESANKVLKQWGEPPAFAFVPKQHFELGEALGMMDFATAAKLAGARFTLLRGPLARLERALGQFMLDLHTGEHGYQEVIVPLLVNAATCRGTGQLPKFEADLFKTTDGRYLIPTAEVPLTNTVAGEIVPAAALPIRLVSLTECFRSEAGAAGRDTRGYLRQHQFRKVELVSVCRPEDSDAEHERMTRCAERVLERLRLPYRRVVLAAGDTGFSAAKTFDLEVWLPGQQRWREISSCSNTRAFQARRMNARWRGADGKSLEFVHTLNGSGIAVGRTLIAVLENCQQADGSILLPEAVRPYMGGAERITCT